MCIFSPVFGRNSVLIVNHLYVKYLHGTKYIQGISSNWGLSSMYKSNNDKAPWAVTFVYWFGDIYVSFIIINIT